MSLKKRVMISYSHQDIHFVVMIEKSLREAGIEVWRDDQIPLGYDWLETILEEIEKSDHLLLMLSEDSIKSHYVLIEELFGEAKDKIEGRKGFVIPIKIKSCDPPQALKRTQILDLTDENTRSEAIRLLLDTVIGSKRPSLDRKFSLISESALTALMVTIAIIEAIAYWCTFNSTDPSFYGGLMSICIPVFFAFFIIFGFAGGMLLKSRKVIVISIIAGLIALWPTISSRVNSSVRQSQFDATVAAENNCPPSSAFQPQRNSALVLWDKSHGSDLFSRVNTTRLSK